MLELDTLLDQLVPATEAAAIAFGVSVLTRAQDETAGATVRLGQRLLGQILNRGAAADPVRVSVTDLAEAGEDRDLLALRRAELRIALRNTLRDCPNLAAELSAELRVPLSERPTVRAVGERSVAIGGNNFGPVSTGDGAAPTPSS
ncbi:hypothetical protein ACI2L1_07030 [Streptomyces sp. NPDC019531]|uniref:hypothetical protein n=1 Tax=Streptomyces sp. NPDC019531 TaxID=3365062 RepID=UPI00384D64B0